MFSALPAFCLMAAENSSEPLPPKNPDWIKKSVLYEVFLRDFSPEGKFANLENDLLRLKNLGVNALVLLPVNSAASPSSHAPQNPLLIKDFSAVSLDYGTKDGLKRFSEQVRYNEMKLILSWVVDRASQDNALVKDHPKWFALKSSEEDAAESVAFDYSSKEARAYMKDMLVSWLKDYSLDGFSLIGGDKIPADFLKEIAGACSTAKPSAVVIAEASSPASVHLIPDKNFYGTISNVALGMFPASQMRSVLDEDVRRTSDWPWPVRFLEGYDRPRSAQLLGPAVWPSAVLLFTMDGVPMISAGQEILESQQTSSSSKNPIDWAGGLKINAEARKFYKKLIASRMRHPSLSRGQKFAVPAKNEPSLFVFAASYREDAVLVAVNYSASSVDTIVEVPDIFLSAANKLRVDSVFGSGKISQVELTTVSVKLPPWGYEIWELK